MLFNSLTFVAFFAVLLVAYYSLRNWRLQKSLLLVASYAFYAAWNPPFVVLLWISTFIDWFAAKHMHTEERRGRRIALLCVSLAANLGLLGFFKYGGFVLENFQNVVGFYGMTFEAAKPDIILPVGISFYTFQTLSYTLDVFLGSVSHDPGDVPEGRAGGHPAGPRGRNRFLLEPRPAGHTRRLAGGAGL